MNSPRLQAWKDAIAYLENMTPDGREYTYSTAEQAVLCTSHKALDTLEYRRCPITHMTNGSLEDRLRFWRFILYISRGITPRDLA